MSIKYRIAFLFALLVTILFTIAGLAIYYFVDTEHSASFNQRLKNRALSTARLYAGLPDSSLFVLKRVDSSVVVTLLNKAIQVRDYKGNIVYRYTDKPGEGLPATGKDFGSLEDGETFYFSEGQKKAIAIRRHNGDQDFTVLVAAEDTEGKEFLAQLSRVLLLALAGAIVLSFFAGLFFASRIISPVKHIASEIKLISSNNLSSRIGTAHGEDELGVLIQTINGLLDRLQDSFAIQRRFISNASHELSTPLTSISTQIEVAMQKKRSTEEYQQILESVQEDIIELQQLTRSLLDIAKMGSQGSIDLEPVRIDELLFKVASDVQIHNPGFRAVLKLGDFPEDERLLTVFGNPDLLYMALRNIIENGCKYADNHRSEITALFSKAHTIIRVANKGEVITEADIQHIFQPFFRARSASVHPGFGLGLTLTKRILSLHKGSIEVTSHFETGTVFSITLPNTPQ
jgi:two-component system, OmpR family, sensor histidine kinase ArlS